MNVAETSFRTDLARQALQTSAELERQLKSAQKRLAPWEPECDLIREKLRKAYEDVILIDYNLAQEADVETSLWMKLHHKTIESFRSRISKFTAAHGKSKPVEFRKLLLQSANFIKDAAKYYRNLIHRLIVHFDITELRYVLHTFKLDIPIQENQSVSYSRELKDSVIRSCHVSLIHLGDLSRYKELQAVQRNAKHDWGPALGYYQFARRLLPNAGTPMNQLAVVAIYTDNVLGSAYYFLRALCAVEAFPTARDNLVLGYKKMLNKEKVGETGILNLFIKLHAGIYLKDKYPTVSKDQREVLSTIRKNVKERMISGETLSQLACVNIASLYLATQVSALPNLSSNQKKIELYNDLNLAFISLLLEILTDEVALVGTNVDDPSTQISAVMRRVLPALRISSKWLKLHLLDARPIWTKYVQGMTLCGSKFQRTRLPQLISPLEEDLDMRGFLPLEGGLSGSPLPEHDIGTHPNEETLARLSDLLGDAAHIASQLDMELARTLGHPPSTSQHPQAVFPSTSSAPEPAEVSAPSVSHQVFHPHASEPSMAFSLNQMVDQLVGDEELVFKGRKSQPTSNPPTLTSHPAQSTEVNWKTHSPLPMPQSDPWFSPKAVPGPYQNAE